MGLALAAACFSQHGRAATDTWGATPSTGNWATAGNWSDASNAVPASGDSLVYGASTITSDTDNLMTPATYSIAGITFNSGAPAYTITPYLSGDNGFTLTGAITNNSTSLDTINDLITTTSVETITTTSGGGNITLGGNITGSGGGFTLAGAGTLTLSGSNSFTGSTTTAAGTTLAIGNNYALGAGTLVLNNATGTVQASGGSITISNPVSLAVNGISGIIGGSNILNLNGLVTNTAGANTTLTINNSAATTLAGGLALANSSTARTVTLNGSGNITISGVIANGSTSTSGLTYAGTGTLTLGNANTYTGTTTVGSGTLLLDFTSANAPAANIISTGNNSALFLGSGNATTGANEAASSETLTLKGAASATNSQSFAGVTLTPGASHIILTPGAGGTMSVQLGYIQAGSVSNTGETLDISLPANASATTTDVNTNGIIAPGSGGSYVTVGGTTWATSAATALAGVASNSSGNVLTVSSGAPANGTQVSFSTIPTGSGLTANTTYYVVGSNGSTSFQVSTSAGGSAITLATSTGNGTADLQGALTGLATSSYGTSYAGGATENLDAGAAGGTLTSNVNTIRFNNAPSSGSTITVTAGTTATTQRDIGGSNAGGAILVTGNVGSNLSDITGGILQGSSRRQLVIIQNNTSGNLEIDSSIGDISAGAQSLTKSGAGTLLLTANNVYTGQTILNEGTTIVTGGTTALATLTGTCAASSATVTMPNTAGVFVGEEVTQAAGLTGNTTWFVTAINPNTSVTLSANAVNSESGVSFTFGGAGGLGTGTGTVVHVGYAATLQIGNGGSTGALFAGQSIVDAGAVAFDRTDNALNFSNVISGAGAVNQIGTGMTTLTGANTYTGATSVTSGTLQIGNGAAGSLSNSSALSVSSGATLSFDEATASTQSNTISDAGTVAGAEGSGITDTLSGGISGAGAFVQSGVGATVLSASNSYTGGTLINSGTLVAQGSNGNNVTYVLGAATSPVTLGNSTTQAPATLEDLYFNTWPQPVTVASGTGAYTFITNGSNLSGQATITTGLFTLTGTDTLNIVLANASPYRPYGGVSGTGNIIVNTQGSGNVFMENGAFNNVGTVTNASTGAGGISQGNAAGIFGANVTSLIQNSATAPFTLNQANSSFAGSVQVLSGSFQLANVSSLDAANQVFVGSSGTLDVQQSNTIAGLSNVSGAGGAVLNSTSTARTLTLGGAGSYTYGGVIVNGAVAGGLALTMNGSGTQLLTGSNSYTGATSITGGTLQTGNAYALSTSAVTQSGSGTLDLDGQTISNTLSLSGAGAGGLGALINSNTGTPAAVLGDIASNNFTVGGAGNLTLTTATNNNGIFTVTDIGPGALTLGGTTLNYLMAVNVNGGTVILAKGNATADNDWAIDRGATVTSGTLQIGAAGEQIGFDQGVTVNGGAFNLAGFNTSINFLAGTGGVVTSGSAAATLTVGTIQNGTSETTTTYSGVLQDGSAALSLVKTGTSTLTLSGNNTFSGGATVSAGTLQLGNANALGSNTGAVSNGATLDLDGQTIPNALSISGTGIGNLGALINSNTGAPAEVLGNILANNFTVGGAGNTTLTQMDQANSGVFTVTKAGTGTLTLGGTTLNKLMALTVGSGTVVLDKLNANTTSDWAIDRGATITGGTLKIGAIGEQIQTDQGITVNGGTFDLAGFSTPINYLAGSGGIVTNSGSATATLTVGATQFGSTETTATYSGVLQDGNAPLALTKSGTSTLTLTGVSTYSGATTVNGGTLIVSGQLSGSAPSAVGINSSAILGGTGTILGPVTVNQGGTIYPGAGLSAAGATMTLGGNLTLSASSNITANVNTSGNYDQLIVDGAMTLDPSNTDTLTLDVLGAIPSTPEEESYEIALYGTLNVGSARFASVNLTGDPAIFQSITYGAGTADYITVNLEVIPEPRTWSMMLGGMGVLIAFQRVRRRKGKFLRDVP